MTCIFTEVKYIEFYFTLDDRITLPLKINNFFVAVDVIVLPLSTSLLEGITV